MSMVYRATRIIRHSDLHEVIDEPENVRIQLAHGVKSIPFDIGALAYMVRDSRQVRIDHRGLAVCLATFLPERRALLLKIFDMVWAYQNNTTARSMLQKLAQIFEWSDKSGYARVFIDPLATSTIYREYSEYLYDRLQSGAITPVTANSLQRFFCRLIEVAFPTDYLHIAGSAVAIRSYRRLGKGPSEAQVSIYIRTCLALAKGLSASVLAGDPFPWRLRIDTYEATIFPGNGLIYTPYAGRLVEVYNVGEQRILTVEEYIAKLGNKNLHGRSLLEFASINVHLAQNNLQKANIDLRSEYRLRHAKIASKAYANLFIAITGCSVSELAQFDYSDALLIEKGVVKKEFSAVKLRASGRLTRYAIGVGVGTSLLKEYLRLRAWLLNGRSFEKLFFSLDEDRDLITRVSGSLTYNLYTHMKDLYLDPNLPHLGSRMFRRYKSLVLHTLGFEPRVVADALNHSLVTNLTDYTGGTVEKQSAELGLFWKSVKKASDVVREEVNTAAVPIAAGHCEGFNNPIPCVENVEIAPSCSTQYGCLFCSNYKCHVDEEDIHKLLSLQFVIQSIRRSSPNLKHSEHLFKKLSIRLQYVLNEMSSHSDLAAAIVAKMRKQVEEYGVLTPFWESHLQRYERLGVVF
ncbi:hypothetical protein [Pseudomonas oryzihabitans]|uniref:hypothetical protein n=1 Tax=Pseudomonas oryzihabitans TaxID=47885 RepID=UPI001643DFA8|nr:hypothetical protein [Pseudomonas oryzihabitans]